MTFHTRLATMCLIAGTATLAGCGAAAAPGHSDRSPPLSLHALASLTNYRARLSSGTGRYHMTITTAVHSPDNWQATSGFTVRHIGAVSYVRAGRHWLAHHERVHTYAQENLPAFARQFYAMTRIDGTTVRRGGPCRQAGLAGRTWTIRATGGSSFGQRYIACVADDSGALLRLSITASGAAENTRDATELYQITAVGGVAAFNKPTNVSEG